MQTNISKIYSSQVMTIIFSLKWKDSMVTLSSAFFLSWEQVIKYFLVQDRQKVRKKNIVPKINVDFTKKFYSVSVS